MCGNRINLVYNSEFLAFLQLSGMQFYFYLPKYKQLYTFTISKYKMQYGLWILIHSDTPFINNLFLRLYLLGNSDFFI